MQTHRDVQVLISLTKCRQHLDKKNEKNILIFKIFSFIIIYIVYVSLFTKKDF